MTPIEVKVTDHIVLDAGTIEETAEHFTIRPPGTPMIDQLLAQLDEMPERTGDFKIEHLGVGFTALCVRWGTYLATLMDASTELHPAIPSFHKPLPDEYGFISDSEMKRMNIEVSFNLFRLVQVFRERGHLGLTQLLWKSYAYLPMLHERVPRSREAMNMIQSVVFTGSLLVAHVERGENPGILGIGEDDTPKPIIRHVAPQVADRFLANALAYHHWRNTIIEDIHAGIEPPQGLKPHQQRFTKNSQLAVMKEVAANFGSILSTMNLLFDENYSIRDVPAWPHTATAVANSLYGMSEPGWSLTDACSAVILDK